MPTTIGCRSDLPEIIAAGNATRYLQRFDVRRRSRAVEYQIAEAGKFPWWPVPIALLLLFLPSGWVIGIAGLAIFGMMVNLAPNALPHGWPPRARSLARVGSRGALRSCP